jgi:peptide/nickel transport system permease protein
MPEAVSHEIRARSPLSLAWSKLNRHTMSLYGGMILLVLYLLMIFADFISPYTYYEGAKDKSYFWPTIVHWRDEAGKWTRPYVFNGYRLTDSEFKEHYVEGRPENAARIAEWLGLPPEQVDTKAYPIRFWVRRGPGRKLFGLVESRLHLFGIVTESDAAASRGGAGGPALAENRNPPMLYVLGADHLGRDMLSRLCYGSRVSLTIGIVSVLISFSIGMLLGGISGYFSGTTDVVIQRLCEMMMMVPGFYLLLALRSSFDAARLSSTQIYFAVVVILSFIGWAGMARTVRGMVLGVSRSEYVLAARALGGSSLRVILRHVLPSTLSYAIVTATLAIPAGMLGESGLSFLGLGIQDPEASWGNMLQQTMNIVNIRYYPWLLAPGVMIFISVVAFQFLGDGLRDAFDPRTIVRASGRKRPAV